MIDLGEMVRECLELTRLRYGLNEKHLIYSESLPSKHGARVSGDIDELRAAFSNLSGQCGEVFRRRSACFSVGIDD